MRIAPQFDDDKLHEECGVFGILNRDGAAALTALGLHALQHRGQEGAGIVSCDGERFFSERRRGLVNDAFSREDVMDRLVGNSAIGHVRYATAGGSSIRNVQPMFAEVGEHGVAVAHNGNLTNSNLLRRHLSKRGAIFQSTSDTECVLHLMAFSEAGTPIERLADAMRQVEGAYSLVALTTDALLGVRDPLGVRPLVIGKLDESYILTSETCALDIIGAEWVRDVDPGELVVIRGQTIESLRPFPTMRRRFCIFEHVYFARPDSRMDGRSVNSVRQRIGAELAIESPVDADVVVPVPDSGVPAALGYAQQSGIEFQFGIIRNHYVGRTFIEPTDNIRHLGVRLKHNADRAQLEGRRVVLVDDSIVRGTTSERIVAMVREAGASEVHLRIASPPTTHSCFYGVDTPERSKLLAAKMAVADMAAHVGAESLAFISIDGLYRAVGAARRDNDNPNYCDACFTGDYPTALTDQENGGNPRQLSLLAEQS